MFHRLGVLISRHWVLVILAWICLALGLHAVAPRWESITHDGDLAYLPAIMPSVEGELLMSRAFPGSRSKSQIAMIVERPTGTLTSEDRSWVEQLAQQFEDKQGELPIVAVWSHTTEIIGPQLVSRRSENGQAAVIMVQLSNEFMAADNIRVVETVLSMLDQARRDQSKPAGLELGITGSAAIGGDMLISASQSIKNTELATVALVIGILLLVYRAPVLVFIPLVTIGVSLVAATDLLALLTQLNRVKGFEWWTFKVFTTTKIFIIVILFGAGTDFCLFLISRFKEELQHGLSRGEAAAESIGQVGGAVVGSAMTTILGLGMMIFAAFGKFHNSGPAVALCLAVTLVACLTLAPALLRACGSLVFWPFGVRVHPPQADDEDIGITASPKFSGFWGWASRAIMARPGVILVGSFLLLAPLAYAGRSTKITYDFLSELQKTRPSVLGTEMARRHFPEGEMAPVAILALNERINFDSREGRNMVARLTKILYDMDGIERVRSLTEPLGDRPGVMNTKKLLALRHRQTKAIYLTHAPELAGQVTRFDLIFEFDPFSATAIELLDRVDQKLHELSHEPDSPWHGTKFTMLGTTVGIRDLKAVTESDQVLIQQLVVISVLAVLIVLLRRPVLCAYLIFSVLLSYYVTIGATEEIFAWWHGPAYHGLDWKVGIFLFVILIAVGEDYNIFLVTRVLEEQRRYGPIHGLQVATARTGGIITSCGVIMAGTFISMMTGTLQGMQQLGLSLSMGVMLDTCVVRPILVPAFMALMERLHGWQRRGPDRPAALPRTNRAGHGPELTGSDSD